MGVGEGGGVGGGEPAEAEVERQAEPKRFPRVCCYFTLPFLPVFSAFPSALLFSSPSPHTLCLDFLCCDSAHE